MNGYELTRNWFNFSFENHEAKVQHTALFCWIVELNNRLGWKKEFGLPTIDTMEGLSIGNKNTFLAALSDLEKWGFIKIIKPSKNQYQACIISICCSKSATAQGTALDTALQQQSNGIGYGIGDGIGDGSAPIDKQTNKETIKKKKNIEKKELRSVGERQKDFYNELKSYVETYGAPMVRAFYDYWSELTNDGKLMNKETRKTWETKKRLATWQRNDNQKFGNNQKPLKDPKKPDRIVYDVFELDKYYYPDGTQIPIDQIKHD